MSNAETEKRGLAIAIQYEKQRGRNRIVPVRRCGYDLISKNDHEERHIEVKSTEKSHFTFRWLEELEYQKMQSDPNWYLYLVADIYGDNPIVVEYNKEKLEKLFSGETIKYNYSFPKSDFYP
ncbi:MAG: DUF3883 domain-containing protein [Bacillota bacterium]|nr:DUF3883 domain-containing protein [Bacillota bacterium]MDW7677835.1 DUF3883 domain-containing protein [Bacillota bacterium]